MDADNRFFGFLCILITTIYFAGMRYEMWDGGTAKDYFGVALTLVFYTLTVRFIWKGSNNGR